MIAQCVGALIAGLTCLAGAPPHDYGEASRILPIADDTGQTFEKNLIAAAKKGDALSEWLLAGLYVQGTSTIPHDDHIARMWAEKAAAQGFTPAVFMVGTFFALGRGVPVDYAEAKRWFLLAAEKGDLDAANLLGVMYENGTGVPQDYGEAAKWFRQAAEKEHADAQVQLARLYAFGNGVPKDEGLARAWAEKAALKGSADGQAVLAQLYMIAADGGQDYQQAMKWSSLAAQQGNPAAEGFLGDLYYHGWGVPKDLAAARGWYLKAAEHNDARGQLLLGRMYYDGAGVAKDHVHARRLYMKALDQVEHGAKVIFPVGDLYNVVGVLYATGDGGEKNYSEARKWLLKSAALGIAEAKYGIGWLYENGRGVPRNLAQAKEWYRKAAEQGDEEAAARLNAMNNPQASANRTVPVPAPYAPPDTDFSCTVCKIMSDQAREEEMWQTNEQRDHPLDRGDSSYEEMNNPGYAQPDPIPLPGDSE